MGWNLLAYVIPAVYAIKTDDLEDYGKALKSRHAPLVQEIAERIFAAEHQPGALYYTRVQEMIQQLPRLAEKNIQGLVTTRIRVVARKKDDKFMPIHSTGTEKDTPKKNGCYYISIPDVFHPDIPEQETLDALPWLTAREIGHFLAKDKLCVNKWIAVASFVAAFTATFFLGWGLLASTAVTFSTAAIASFILRRRAETRADEFANRHCTLEERGSAVTAFEKIKGNKEKFSGDRLFYREAHHPSYASRIAKIRASLTNQPSLNLAPLN